MKIRPITFKDIRGIAKILSEVTLENYKHIVSEKGAIADAKFKLKECMNDASFVAEKNKKIVGFIFTRLIIKWKKKAPEISSFGVAGKHRKQGIGTVLLSHAIDSCKRLGYKEIFLETQIENKKAVKLYEKLGFKKKKYMMEKSL